MQDITAAFAEYLREKEQDLIGQSIYTTASMETPEAASEPLTMEKLRSAYEALNEIPFKPMRIRISEHAAALPDKVPHTDDMRDMVERIGKQRVPACLFLRSMFGEMYVVHPELLELCEKGEKER